MFAGNGHGATTTRAAVRDAGPTPGPYYQGGPCFGLGFVVAIHDGPDADGNTFVDGRHHHTVATCDRVEDAAKIVRAMNAYDPMLAALRTLVSYAEWQVSEGETSHPTLSSAVGAARAAIAKAQGREG